MTTTTATTRFAGGAERPSMRTRSRKLEGSRQLGEGLRQLKLHRLVLCLGSKTGCQLGLKGPDKSSPFLLQFLHFYCVVRRRLSFACALFHQAVVLVKLRIGRAEVLLIVHVAINGLAQFVQRLRSGTDGVGLFTVELGYRVRVRPRHAGRLLRRALQTQRIYRG